MKRVFLLGLLLCCLTSYAFDFEVDGFYYNITNQSNNEVAVTYKTSSYNSYSGVINIPSSVGFNGTTYTVTSIGSNAFRECTSLISVTIPNSVTSINNNAFSGCTGLISVTISNSVTSIGSYAFYYCSNIKSLTIGSGVTSIGSYAFYYCSNIKSLTIGSGVTSIGSYAFSGTIPKVFWLGNTPPSGVSNVSASVNYVSNSEFRLSNKVVYPFLSSRFEVDGVVYVPVSPSDRTCDAIDCNYDLANAEVKIDSVVVNKNVELKVLNVNDYAFYKNPKITKLEISNSGFIGSYAFYDCDALTSVILGNNVTAIGSYTFRGNSSLETIVIPNNITYIGTDAFSDCTSLKNVSIGKGITSLPLFIFNNCTSLPSIFIPNTIDNIDNYAFYGCTNLGDVTFEELKNHGQQSDLLPIKLGSNGSSPLFSSCKLDEVYIGRKLSYKTSSSYGYSPFYRNTSLRKVTITDAETQIYDNEFYGCSNLQEFSCGDGVTSIGKRAFSGCSSLESYLSGTSVESIGQEAFSDCTAMTSFTSNAEVPPTCGTQALDDINKWECTLYVPQESVDDYQAAPQWKEFFFIDKSGVEDVFIDNGGNIDCPIEIYNLSGVRIGNSTETLAPGIYIKRQGNKAEKIMIK